MSVACNELIWTDHALERAAQRFGENDRTDVPHGAILSKMSRLEDGGEGFVVHGDVVYVCLRSGSTAKVITVLRRDEWENRLYTGTLQNIGSSRGKRRYKRDNSFRRIERNWQRDYVDS